LFLADTLSEVIEMNRKYPDLITLLSQDRKAMEYFKSLPVYVNTQMDPYSGKINTLDDLRSSAEIFLKK
jgi:hypothetical protein